MLKNVKEIAEGDVLAQDVHNDGILIARAGTVVTPAIKERLKKWNVGQVHISEDPSCAVHAPEQPKPLKVLFYETLKRIASEKRYGFSLQKAQTLQMLEKQFTTLMSDKIVADKMFALKAWDAYSFDHSVDVFILGSLLGQTTGVRNWGEFSAGCLLHDVGKENIPQDILTKPGKLTNEEFRVMTKHTIFGYKWFTKKAKKYKKLAELARSHHERLDGSGYPRGLSAQELNHELRMLAIVDVYSALTLKRPYRDPLSAPRALEILFRDQEKFDSRLLKMFANLLSIYPAGAHVSLTDGREATVIYINEYLPTLPRLKCAETGETMQIPNDLSLAICDIHHWNGDYGEIGLPENNWNQFLDALAAGDRRQAADYFSLLADSRRVEDIYENVLGKAVTQLEEKSEKSTITMSEFSQALGLSRELLYTTLQKNTLIQEAKGKIVLCPTNVHDHVFPLEIAAAILTANHWRVHLLEFPVPADDLVTFLTLYEVKKVAFYVSSATDCERLHQTIVYLKKNLPALQITAAGPGVNAPLPQADATSKHFLQALKEKVL